MNRKLIIRYSLLITFWLISLLTAAQGWVRKADLPVERSGGAGFAIGSFGYVAAGERNGAERFDVVKYDPTSDTWSTVSDVPGGPRTDAFSFVINDQGYVGCGSFGLLGLNSAYVYDAATDNWTAIANFPGLGRVGCYSGSLNGIGYVGGGSAGVNSPVFSQEWWAYNPSTDAWSRKADIPIGGRKDGVCFTLGNFIYIACGANNLSDINEVWRYDPTTDAWQQRAIFPGLGYVKAHAFIYNGEAYVGGGSRIGNFQTTAEYYRYNAAADAWTFVPGLMSGRRANGASFTLKGIGYVVGGLTPNGNDRIDTYSYVQCGSVVTDLLQNDSTCANSIVTLSIPGGAEHIVWSTGVQNSDQLQVGPGTYWVEAIYQGCIVRDTAIVAATGSAPTIPRTSFEICKNETIELDINSVYSLEGRRIEWNTGATTEQISIEQPGVYIATVETDCGETQWGVVVRQGDCGFESVYIPSAFTPNGDGLNDVFTWQTQNVRDFKIDIFNRWGDRVFSSNDINGEWDGAFEGRLQQPGPYAYVVRGVTTFGEQIEETGYLTILP